MFLMVCSRYSVHMFPSCVVRAHIGILAYMNLSMSTGTEEKMVWGSIVRWCIYIIALLTPIWFLPITVSPVEINKMMVVAVLAIVGFIAWLGQGIYMGEFRIPRTWVLLALLVWLLVFLAAAFFSLVPHMSMWGDVAGSLFNMVLFGLILFLASVGLNAREVVRVNILLLISGGVVALLFLLHTLFNLNVFPWDVTGGRTFNTVGTWNTLGIFFAFLLVSTAPLFEYSWSRMARIAFMVLALAAVVFAAIVNFSLVWVGVGLLSLAYLAYELSRSSKKSFGMPLVLLLIAVLLFLARDNISVLSAVLSPPLDVTPSTSTTITIGRKVITERPLLGMGPGMFANAWDLYKDPSVNGTIFWQLRFSSGASFAATLLTTTGVLGFLAFVVFVVTVVVFGMYVVGNAADDDRRALVLSNFFGAMFLLFSLFIYPLSITIAVLLFLSIGILVAHARIGGLVEDYILPIVADSPKGFVAALVLILLMVLGIIGLYVSGQKYLAAIFYGRGIVFSGTGNINTAEQYFSRAVRFNPNSDQYLRSLTDVSFAKLQRIAAGAEGANPDNVRSDFRLALSSAITSAQAATQVQPYTALNWRVLGQVYESVVPVVEGSDVEAIAAYEKAVERSPLDPVLRDDLARVYVAKGDYVHAREMLDKALELKGDYATAHFRVAQIAALKGDVHEATAATERAAASAPNDTGILFQLGLLYYQQHRFNDAEQALAGAVALNHNFSNARYFLGLILANRGDSEKAKAEFEKILELNPGNAEIEHILANLSAGKLVLDGISPPGPGPLERDTPPAGEESARGDSVKTGEDSSGQ